MTYDPHNQSAESIDQVRRTRLARSESRPSSKLRRSTTEDRKALTRASGRLRTAAWRCDLDTKRRPESDVVGLALLTAVATWPKGLSFDPASIAIVVAAFDDLMPADSIDARSSRFSNGSGKICMFRRITARRTIIVDEFRFTALDCPSSAPSPYLSKMRVVNDV
jgi:hypothetical protein